MESDFLWVFRELDCHYCHYFHCVGENREWRVQLVGWLDYSARVVENVTTRLSYWSTGIHLNVKLHSSARVLHARFSDEDHEVI